MTIRILLLLKLLLTHAGPLEMHLLEVLETTFELLCWLLSLQRVTLLFSTYFSCYVSPVPLTVTAM